jgi:hypothetical protein
VARRARVTADSSSAKSRSATSPYSPMSSRLTMMPASQPATSSPPNRGSTATTTPAAISTTPTAYMICVGAPGSRSAPYGAR